MMTDSNLRVCKKCDAKVVPKCVEQGFSGAHSSYYACPVCGNIFKSFNMSSLYAAIGIVLLIWAVLFIHYHLTN